MKMTTLKRNSTIWLPGAVFIFTAAAQKGHAHSGLIVAMAALGTAMLLGGIWFLHRLVSLQETEIAELRTQLGAGDQDAPVS